MHDDVNVLPRSASSPSGAAPVLAASVPDQPSVLIASPARAARREVPSLEGSVAVFGRSVVASYMRRCLLHSNCSPESPTALTLHGLPCSHCSPLVSCTALGGGSLCIPSSLWRLSSLLPSWSRSKWWSAVSRHTFHSFYCASPSTPADITGGRSNYLQRCSTVMTTLCGLFVGSSSSGGGTRVPFYLVGDVVSY